ncbi:riboflavin synthase [Krasilnikoviella flava]|uniref:Riboflavin synthase n=1 Tax=Krasilnikoviella flava TaxID=526729 RepID=A0A1T5L435_9MICO|nr:riboflavin synthase [Krasilnikoviella flava]SKC70802.1 riboflavin synthase alpha chain [Krasilnikoviella flava]
MFTGIVEELGTVVAVREHADGARLTVAAETVLDGVRLGDSIAVDGCCLTVAETGEHDGRPTWTADLMAETLARTGLGARRPGDPVNLERALAADGRFGGHVVQGHVDGVGTVLARTPGTQWEVVEVALPAELARYVVAQGSIAVDGVSLTVVSAGEESFTVSLIPETRARTTLGARAVGQHVNLEVDVLSKYVERHLAHGPVGAEGAR